MLELLLFTYKEQFGEEFPLKQCEDMREIDIINLLYECVQSNTPYREGMHVQNRSFGAPGQK